MSDQTLDDEINALPERLRKFILGLESRADPAHDLRRAFTAEQNAAALLAANAHLRALLTGWRGYAWKDGAYIDDLQKYFDEAMPG